MKAVLGRAERLSDSIMAIAINLLREISNGDTFISSGFAASLIRQRGGTQWNRIPRLFLNDIASHRGDSLYIIPSYYGSEGIGHWYTNLVLIEDGRSSGFTIDSLGTEYGIDKTDIRRCIKLGFRIEEDTTYLPYLRIERGFVQSDVALIG